MKSGTREPIEGFRVSPQQGRLWLLASETSVYNTRCAVLLEGTLDRRRLKEVLRQLVQQHEILRTTFSILPGMRVPLQVIGEEPALSYREIDLSELRPPEQEARTEELFLREGSLTFDLEHGPVARFSLLIRTSWRHVLLISLPAMCGDGRTLENLVAEVRARYAGSEAAPGDVVQYVQFSEWQSELLEDGEGKAGHEYWRNQSAPTAARPALPFEASSRPGDVSRRNTSRFP